MNPYYPRWLNRSHQVNLREVASGLYVGAERAPYCMEFDVVVDLYGSTPRGRSVLSVPIQDGAPFPAGVLDSIMARTARARGPVLIHCHAGLSRSVSAAYAMLRAVHALPHGAALARVKIHPTSPFPMPQTLLSARHWAAAARGGRLEAHRG